MSVRNKCTFIGRTGGDIEVFHFENGDKKGTVSLAIDESFKDRNGKKQERTTWVTLVARNNVCDIFDKYVGKGDKVVVECKYAPREWSSDDGKSGTAHEFYVLGLELTSAPSKTTEHKLKKPTAKKEPVGVPDSEGDLPF